MSTPEVVATLHLDAHAPASAGPLLRIVRGDDGGAPQLGWPHPDGGGLRPVAAGDGAVTALVERWQQGGGADGLRLRWDPAERAVAVGPERRISTDHANLSIATGEVLVKLLRDLGADARASLTTVRHLATVGFDAVPQLLGSVTYADAGRAALVATASRLLPAAEEGWGRFRDLADACLRHGAGIEVASLPAAAGLGRLVARFHLAMATPSAVLPRPERGADADDHAAWAARATSTLSTALDVVDGAPGAHLRRHAAELQAAVAALGTPVPGRTVLRLHGDLHVGQVLHAEGRDWLTDLDGDPTASGDGRTAQGPAARDLAGLLRSLDHAGRLAARRGTPVDDDRVDAWIAAVRTSCTAAYRGTLADAGRDDLLDLALLAPFEAAQVAHELVYATRHLPSWLPVADAAMRGATDRRLTGAP